MRTLTLLAALLLVALQAQAEPLLERAYENPAQQQPGAEDQDVAISFAGDHISALQAADPVRRVTCYCRGACSFLERIAGFCRIRGVYYRLCCR
ncbi:PREDICTED: defensin-5-like [Galeopterus variegatus]|uniref:Defensin-5-like n=1 Tax=Galeopterus variegatus TaxID=482537 RepID=A0ABM0SIE2_GALVR|nr:PREDICTED: defensin-5-like [Galeopterus variegatus]